MKLIKPKRYETSETDALVPKGAKQTEEYLNLIPNPVGYRLLVRPWSGKAKTAGGVYLSDKTQETIEMTTVVGLVIKMGELCYKDKNRFPSGPWCKKGDWVVFRAYSGTRMKMYGKEFRLINDDTVEAVVEDPTGVVRA